MSEMFLLSGFFRSVNFLGFAPRIRISCFLDLQPCFGIGDIIIAAFSLIGCLEQSNPLNQNNNSFCYEYKQNVDSGGTFHMQ